MHNESSVHLLRLILPELDLFIMLEILINANSVSKGLKGILDNVNPLSLESKKIVFVVRIILYNINVKISNF